MILSIQLIWMKLMCLLKLYSFIIFSTIISSVAPMFKPPSETECTNHTLKSALELTIWWARKNNKQTIKMQCYKCLSGREKHRALLEYRRGVDWRSKSLGSCLWVCFGVLWRLSGQNGSSYSTIPSLSGMLWWLKQMRGSGGGGAWVGMEHRVQEKATTDRAAQHLGSQISSGVCAKEVAFPVEEMRSLWSPLIQGVPFAASDVSSTQWLSAKADLEGEELKSEETGTRPWL